MNQRTIINHKWQCKCGVWIGEDYDECPFCKQKEEIKKIIEKKFPIKSECASCGKEFATNEENYQLRGNYCLDCCAKIDKMMRWRTLRHKESRSSKQEKEFLKLGHQLLNYWGIVMEENDKKFQGFKNYLQKVFVLKD